MTARDYYELHPYYPPLTTYYYLYNEVFLRHS